VQVLSLKMSAFSLLFADKERKEAIERIISELPDDKFVEVINNVFKEEERYVEIDRSVGQHYYFDNRNLVMIFMVVIYVTTFKNLFDSYIKHYRSLKQPAPQETSSISVSFSLLTKPMKTFSLDMLVAGSLLIVKHA